METDKQEETLLLFAYGTLRKDEPLHGWIEKEVVRSHGTAKMPRARLYYPKAHNGYPYLVLTDSPSDEAIGEVFEVPINEQIIRMFQMEINAGYSVSEAEAELADGTTVDVAVCEWSHPTAVGDEVPGNDWRSPERMGWWR